MEKIKNHIFLLCCCLGLFAFHAASQTVEVSMNRNEILIGQQISYGLKVKLPGTGLKANFAIPDSLPHFDIIRKGEVVGVKGESAIEQVVVFTSFDSGQWYFPSFPVLITDGARKATLFSDSVLIRVGYAPADSSGQLRDIKAVMDVYIPDYTLYYILGAVLLALLIAYLLYRYLKNRKNKPAPIFKSDLSAYNEAMQSLQALEGGSLLNSHKEKEYHTELAGIFKRYLSRHTQKNLLNKTTGDILIELNQMDVDIATVSETAEGLRYTDAVKFAKFIPLHSESNQALALIRKSIESIEKTSQTKTT